MSNSYTHLHEDFKHLMFLSDEKRIESLHENLWINYPLSDEIVQLMGQLMNRPKKPRMPGLLIIGESNIGKTSIIHRFTVDSNIISHLITHQAGTPNKALMEIVMNSIDAGATEIDIKATDRTFSVKDNGSGFASRDEVINYFGRFGTPHKEGDATFGRFRMGRGQIMAFSRCSWRSSTFEMNVDIKQNGLTYNLHENLDAHRGCVVSGEFYDTEGQWLNGDQLASQLKFINATLVVNGEIINQSVSEVDWDYEGNTFYYKKDQNYSLSVYNQGVFVKNYSSWEVGVGGTLVSKIPMEVNFARNDVLVADCLVWAEASIYLKKETKSKSVSKNNKIAKYERQYHYNSFMKNEIDFGEFASLRIFEDVTGKVYKLEKLMELNIQTLTISASKGSSYADFLSSTPGVFVFDFNEMQNFGSQVGQGGVSYLMVQIYNKAQLDGGERSQEYMRWYDRVEYIFNNIENLRTKYPLEAKIFKKSELSILQDVALKSLKNAVDVIGEHASWHLYRCGEIAGAKEKNIRKLVLGDSGGTMNAWTDGSSYIALDYKTLETYIEAGQDGVLQLLFLILHEYTHNDASVVNNVHGLEFYQSYHEMTLHRCMRLSCWHTNNPEQFTGFGLFDLAYRTGKKMYNLMVKHEIKISHGMEKFYGSGLRRSTIQYTMQQLRIIWMPTNRKIATRHSGEKDVSYSVNIHHSDYTKTYRDLAHILINRSSLDDAAIVFSFKKGELEDAFFSVKASGRNIALKLNKEKIVLKPGREAIIAFIRNLDRELSLLGCFWYDKDFRGDLPENFLDIEDEYKKCFKLYHEERE